MLPGYEFKAALPGGASTRYLTREFFHVPMDFESLPAIGPGHRLGTGAIMVFDQSTCLVAATLNLIEFFAREEETTPILMMHTEDADRLGLIHGDKVALRLEGGELLVELGTASNMAPGVIILPRHRQLEWRKLKQYPVFLPYDGVHKA